MIDPELPAVVVVTAFPFPPSPLPLPSWLPLPILLPPASVNHTVSARVGPNTHAASRLYPATIGVSCCDYQQAVQHLAQSTVVTACIHTLEDVLPKIPTGD